MIPIGKGSLRCIEGIVTGPVVVRPVTLGEARLDITALFSVLLIHIGFQSRKYLSTNEVLLGSKK